MPMIFVFKDSSTYFHYSQYLRHYTKLFDINFIIFVLSRFRVNLLAVNQLAKLRL